MFPHELSSGQRQRVAMARCLVMKPQVLLLDEITSALDPLAVSEVKEVLRKLKQEVALVIVTHDMALASDIADRVVFMADGDKVSVGEDEYKLAQTIAGFLGRHMES
jgi:polar amino acid transport system ATP-binding protein